MTGTVAMLATEFPLRAQVCAGMAKTKKSMDVLGTLGRLTHRSATWRNLK